MIGTAAALAGMVIATLTAGLPLPSPRPATSDSPPGGWVQGDVYDLKVKAVVRCSSTHLGLELGVRSRTKVLFVAPRDARLRDGAGVLYPAVSAPEPPGCRPTLRPTQLRRAAQIGGFVIFEVPAGTGELTLEYAPTRWGGAARISVVLPEPVGRRQRGR